ncbi:MAG: class I SAM-dependent methyltransferase [Nitrospira sp.]|nr:class I SAM-dependent methyltransferase [Nitrospira sp.]MCW5787389.1 class I SAM-dependent methyltransferase [Nitrospira sp.]MDR4473977.1 class I SAM-dependent methyltransferase [Nitrospira sp.]MDR4476949.1 class I SAM-dependent methyltransferase [Nitrospira sp.]
MSESMTGVAGVMAVNEMAAPAEGFVREDGWYAPYDYWLTLWGLYDLYAYALALLGDVKGKVLLDCGCGPGHTSVMLAKRGATVTAFDTADGQLDTARRLATANGVKVMFLCKPFEELDFPDASFDVVFGTFVLHHVDLPKASRQIARLLKPGGKAVFIENSALNPLLMAARSKVCGHFGVPQYSDEHEHPLTRRDIATLQSAFPGACTIHFPSLLFFRLLDFYVFKKRWPWMTSLLLRCDQAAGSIPWIRRYGYLQIVELGKGTTGA